AGERIIVVKIKAGKSKKADFLLSINEGYILKREMAVNITAIRIYFCVICSTNFEKTELLSAERLC
ncbi:hypothetical protein AN697_27715, partial [Enterobacter cloacae subsp. cloacae]|uniref:hypothetical protein n=1 Tax=Enterobacter cloacae TaxID=550 RepID=UPI0006D96438